MKEQFSFKSLLIIFVFIHINLIVKSATSIPAGNVSGTWTSSGSPYNINGDILIPNGLTLTIQAGVIVTFQGHYKLDVQGRLLAIGTAANKIEFMSLDSITGWKGIRYNSITTTNDTSRIEYCIIKFGNASSGGTNDKTGGGIFVKSFSKLIIRNNIITNNFAGSYGGGIGTIDGASPIIINNLICNNTAHSGGGGIYCANKSKPELLNNTIAFNKANYNYGGIYALNSDFITIKNCIIWGNSPSTNQVYPNYLSMVSYSDIQGGYTGTNNINLDPLFTTPSNGVGSIYNGLTANWSLQSSSPCINVGSSGIDKSYLPATDISGNIRMIAGGIDLGAYERLNATVIGGNITTNTSLSGYVLVSSDVTVNNGVTLTISPGTEVRFLGQYALIIQGRLIAIGTFNSAISFTAEYPTTGWKGIRFDNTSATNDTSKIEFCILQYGNASGTGFDNYGGAVFIRNFSKIMLRNNTFCNNKAASYGGAIAIETASPKIVNNIIVNNNAVNNDGGGIFVNGTTSAPLFANNTIANNTAKNGGGIYSNSTLPTIKNCIIWGNAASISNDQVYPSSGISLQYSCVQNGFSGTGNISSNPTFKRPTPGTGTSYYGLDADWSLKSTSGCIDSGSSSVSNLLLPVSDPQGRLRIYNNIVDIGANEYIAVLTVGGTIAQDTYWNADTVKVTSEIYVNSQKTLTIAKGTKVVVKGQHLFRVHGNIIAKGHSNDSIKFYSDTSSGWRGIYIYNSTNDSSIMTFCDVTDVNSNTTAIYINRNKARISNCRIHDNTSSSHGAGMYIYDSKPTIENSIIENNYSGFYGGGIYGHGFHGLLKNNVIHNNTSAGHGGGMYMYYSDMKIIGNLISNNSSPQHGGGAFIGGTTNTPCELINNCIINNNAKYGGGLSLTYAVSANITNNTIANNYASTNGGGINTSCNPTITNTIIYGNSAGGVGGGNEVYVGSVATDPVISYSNIQGGLSGFGGPGSGSNFTHPYPNNIDSNPLFTSPTAGTGTSYNGLLADWSIQGGSPCVNKGTPSVSGLGLPNMDFAGEQRVLNKRIDIGAFETQQDINVCGNVTENTVWDADTIKVTCNITIDNGKILTIMPGTYVEFQGYYSINIQGGILAVGTANEMIRFGVNDTTNFANPSILAGGWNRLNFNNTSITNDSSKLVYCSFQYGKGNDGGALYVYNFSKLLVSNCIFSNNKAYKSGGAIYISYANPVITNSLFCNNSANGYTYSGTSITSGGAMFLNSTSMSLSNNTICNNTARDGAGVYVGGASTLTLNNNIIYGNYSFEWNTSYTRQIHIYSGGSVDIYNCNIQFGTSGITGTSNVNNYLGNISSDPQFHSPSGGPGILYDGINADWSISPVSLCINNGKNMQGLLNTDLSGNNRKVADTLDIGAYECQISNKFILSHPVNQMQCVNNQTSFSVTTSSPFSYQWYKNSLSVPGTNATLTLDSIQLSDTGYYSCLLSNYFGTLHTDSATLTVRIPPIITTHPTHDTTCIGDSASFSIVASGSEPISYLWYNNNGQVPGTYSTYNINSVNPNNVSNYYCIASNNCGSAQSNGANLVMNTPPVISGIPANYTICEDQSLTYSVNATGTSPISYQWFHNNDTISNAITNTFNITSLNTNDAGTYYCKAYNICGIDSTNTSFLVVDSIPEIVSQTSSSSSCVGQSMTFSITASGTAPVTYQWYFNNFSITGATNNFYTINSVQNSDAGTYYCIATNGCGSDQSNNIILTVNQSPTITSQSLNATRCVGQSNTFNITASGTNPITYQWYFGTSSIPSATNNTYTINSLSTSDAGNYYCIASNLCGNAQSANALLTVNTAPTITSQSSNTTKCSGQSSTFLVTTTGTSPITYQWYKDNNPISGAINSVHSISSIDTSNAGNYYCIATNACGNDQSNNITLTVNEPPKINSQSQNSSVCESQSMTFSITATGTAPITYQWYHNNSAITSATNNTFTNNSTATTDAGNYHCVVTNSCGSSLSGNINLTILTQPFITTHSDSSTLCEGQSKVLNVSSVGTSPITYQWYFNNFAIPGAANNFYLLSSINQIDAGNYHCIATNLCGTDQSKNINLVVNEPITILSQSGDSSTCEGESMTFSVVVSGTSPITYMWFFDTIMIPGSNFNSSSIKATSLSNTGSYKCEITNMCGTLSSSAKILTVNANPVVNLGIDTTFCKGGNATLSAGSGYFCNWNNGSNNPQLNVTETGDYFVNVTDINGCNGISDTAHINVIEPYPFEEICVVTVFPTTGKNLIAWERMSGQGIIGYNIYKESVIGGQYQIIGTLPFDSLSIWEDVNSNPKQRADRYRITTIDTCGNESDPSPVHKTIHLTVSPGVTSYENNLHWNHYEGFPFSSYLIYRGTSPSNMTIIDTIQSTLNSWTDINAPSGIAFYQVSAAKNDTCFPCIIRGITKSGPYSQSLSNLKDYSNEPGNYLMVDPSMIVLDSNAGCDETISIFTNSQYWSARTDEEWIQLTPNLVEGTLIVTALLENRASEVRTGSIVINCDGVDDQTIIVDQIGQWNSIKEHKIYTNLRCYPNPFSKSTFIILPENEKNFKTFELYDISGKLVRSVENIKGNRYELFKEGLAEGLYFIKVIADRIYFDKVIVN